MKTNLLASIIINNYNYEKFLPQAVESALAQKYRNVEVIVVDDGSTDGSKDIILGYGDKIIPVFKENGGQASAFNAGFISSCGDVIFFLDSDDMLFPDSVQNVISCFINDSIGKVHWPLEVIDEHGNETGEIIPNQNLPEGDFRDRALKTGPPFFLNPPTSGNAWSKLFLEDVLPMPEQEFRIGADTYLFEMVALFGIVKKVDEPQGAYRIHTQNNYHNKSFSERLQLEIKFYDILFNTMNSYCKKLGLTNDINIWRKNSWFHKLKHAIQDIIKTTEKDSNLILVDDNCWGIGNNLEGRRIYPFLEEDDVYMGSPGNDEKAISELERMHNKGADYIVFAWSSFWWLEEYTDLYKYLHNNYKCVLKNEGVKVFNLKKSP